MSPSIKHLPLISGHTIPQFGFGTYKLVGEEAYHGVLDALELGYRHIDTAQMYGNEAEVGRAIADSPVAREEIFVTSKLNNPNHEPDVARASLERSLEELQLDYLDLFLIHWPLPMHYGGDIMPTWRAMESFVREGLVRSIGVSNFEAHHLQPILDACEVPPSINQIESHPFQCSPRDHYRGLGSPGTRGCPFRSRDCRYCTPSRCARITSCPALGNSTRRRRFPEGVLA